MLATLARAQELPTFLAGTVVATGSTTASILVPFSTIENHDIEGHDYFVRRYTFVTSYSDVVSSNWCYDFSGGSSNFPNSGPLTLLLDTTYQSDNNTGGAPDCNVSGTYYITMVDTVTGKEYYSSYYYNVSTNTFSTVSSATLVATSTPFIRITDPVSNSYTDNNFIMKVAINTGSTTANNFRLTFSSEDQVLGSYTATTTQTGLFYVDVPLAWPEYDDEVYVNAYLYNNLTLRAIHADHRIFVVADSGNPYTIVDGGTILTKANDCDSSSGLSWAVCRVAVALVVPNASSTQAFVDAQEGLATRWPLVYVYETPDLVQSLTSASSSFPSLTINIFNGTTTLISEDMLEDIPFLPTARTLMGLFLYALLVIALYFKIKRMLEKTS